MPARNGGSPGRSISRSRTGRRCTTFTQLPEAFCGGRMANSAPVAGLMLSTSACQVMSGYNIEHGSRPLPDFNMGQVRFLEVGFQPRPTVGNMRKQRHLRLHLLTDLDFEVDDDAGSRGLDLCIS